MPLLLGELLNECPGCHLYKENNTVTTNFSDVAVQGQSILILCFSIIFLFLAIRMQDQQVFHQFKPGAVLYCFHGRNTSQSAGM